MDGFTLPPWATSQPDPSLDPNALRLTARDANRTIPIVRGRTVVIQLEERADGGYVWDIAPTPLGNPRRSSVSLASTNGNSLGAPNLVTYTWLTSETAAGTYPLDFTEARPWNHEVAEKLTITITVTSA